MTAVEVIQGDIPAQTDCDGIVNPANSFLNHGDGLARIIADAADPPWEPHGNPFPTEAEARMDAIRCVQ